MSDYKNFEKFQSYAADGGPASTINVLFDAEAETFTQEVRLDGATERTRWVAGGTHTDWGVLTLLYQDEVGGLQVRSGDGEWVTAQPVPDTFVVNVGDCLERWTNRRLLSNQHRVVNSSDRYRQSIAVFVDPEFDIPVVPAAKDGEKCHYEPTTCGEQVMHSFRKAYG